MTLGIGNCVPKMADEICAVYDAHSVIVITMPAQGARMLKAEAAA